MFGGGSSSDVSLGVRFANFMSNSSAIIRARPDVHFIVEPVGKYEIPFSEFHDFYATAERSSAFHGVGPSLSWKASATIAGNPQAGSIELDWGLNAAFLFGKQKASTHHQTSSFYQYRKGVALYQVYSPLQPPPSVRQRSVTVPDVGASVGLSYRYAGAKLSLGYRGDFFIGAMDTGLDTRKSETRGFFGPYANINIGIGD